MIREELNIMERQKMISPRFDRAAPIGECAMCNETRLLTHLRQLPEVESYVAVDRKRGVLDVSFVPLTMQGRKYKKLVSFKLEVTAKPKGNVRKVNHIVENAAGSTRRYADNSVLATGNWAKIRVAHTGIYELTSELAKRAGFSDLGKVKVYG